MLLIPGIDQPRELPGFEIHYDGDVVDGLAFGTLHTHLHLLVDRVATRMLVQQRLVPARSRKKSANAFAYPTPRVRTRIRQVKIGSLLETVTLVVSPLLMSLPVADVLQNLASNVLWEFGRCGLKQIRSRGAPDHPEPPDNTSRRNPSAAIVREIIESFEGVKGPRPSRLTIRSQADASCEIDIFFGSEQS